MKKGYLYILECCDGSFYTGSTLDIEVRLKEHQEGNGAIYAKKRLPVKLVYLEKFTSIEKAFHKEKQIQGWSRKKKLAIIEQNFDLLPKLAECKNESHFNNK
ncbi:GIY-YIG nuclease family protein [Tenacibaculum sp. MEBiC06402]|uniref:GIY-YIG nuclease family protein n=1 Tax=unclassified Tenacibaculum TaxID=2635139 RepID=UPI003B994462